MRYGPPYQPKAFMSSLLNVESYDTDRDVFIGNYRSEGNPFSVENGTCSNSIAVGGNPCAAMQNRFTLNLGEKKYALFIVGAGEAKSFGLECKTKYSDKEAVNKEFNKVNEYWTKRLKNYSCKTPSEELNQMINIWNQYQCHTTFNWSRSASFNEAGGRDGIDYRDTNQDSLAVVHAIPSEVKNKLLELLKGHMSIGYAMHHFQPIT
jgi:N,N'-diacetylchitobiose phosphorylase